VSGAGLEGLAGLINFRVGAWQDFGYENPPDSMCEDCPHGRTAHLTRAPSRPEPYFCSACECRQYRGPHYATIPPLGERSAKAIEAGHEAIKDIDQLIAQLHQVREQLVSELRQDEDIRAARVDALLERRRQLQQEADQ
jgi:NMD protein affecting ribosome stability and mRNA decay